MDVLEWVWVVVASLAVVVVWLSAESLGNRWWQALPEPIREKGLIRWLLERKRTSRTAHRPPPDA